MKEIVLADKNLVPIASYFEHGDVVMVQEYGDVPPWVATVTFLPGDKEYDKKDYVEGKLGMLVLNSQHPRVPIFVLQMRCKLLKRYQKAPEELSVPKLEEKKEVIIEGEIVEVPKQLTKLV